ncbi:MAG: flagellar export chaperone FliS [Planctomycetota bacterium]|nr:flagellar export chaperone FliS [Planctomycetota bacterium]MDW8372938.1 flagellar export chaperone FliS [Planctomycetota bacterium]
MGAALAYSAYRRSEIETLSPRDLLVKLFEGLERFIEQAAQAMEDRHYERAARSCQRVRDILFELQSTLNFEAGGEIAQRLDALYAFMIRETLEAGLRRDAHRIRQLLRVVRPLTEAWRGIPDEYAHVTSLTGSNHQHMIDLRG